MEVSIPKGAKIAVAMSGGVDSSVTAALLADQGYSVFGMMLRLWSEPGSEAANRCCTPDAMALAKRIAGQVGIPFYAIDAKDVFRETVVEYFLEGYIRGVTPNPCLMCNRHIRWEFLLNRAIAMGAEYLATGHYARVRREAGQPVRLLRGCDPSKDQSYVLAALNQKQLERAVFPIGEMHKSEVRALAERFNLPSASVKDSQDLCFLAGTDYPSFLSRHAPQSINPGDLVTREGKILGQHKGLAFYTIGQRKGLGIASSQALYVLEKDASTNRLIVGGEDQLGQSELSTENTNWVHGVAETEPFKAEIKTRYTARPEPGTVIPTKDGQFKVQFEHPLRDITPGQAAVAYRGDEAIACGIIRGENFPADQFKEVKIIA